VSGVAGAAGVAGTSGTDGKDGAVGSAGAAGTSGVAGGSSARTVLPNAGAKANSKIKKLINIFASLFFNFFTIIN
jgi:hypothetical protein